ncbi:hypothetical protein E1I18_00395 [Mycoplasmopsis mucosicanis]|uniref:Uncharacterized protein n=1 Tax=Mycoplasmopsis mucosicanis TaxID=458208 RepID=A0A507SSJ5_9BACT|nr:hypothetical protein [Mycoplasmopsis mucosicanis]TQC54221.1 hypothetical protein E1I18_00395 [Mycoplasmopsis mucosicanis]
MKYKPLQDTTTMEVVQTEIENKDKKQVKDPQGQISPRAFRVIRSEKIIKKLNLGISFSLMLISLILFAFAYSKVPPFDKKYIGYLIFFASTAFIFFALGTKNSIEDVQWSNTIKRYREALSNGDYTSSNTFHLAYKRIVLKGVNITWILIFILTYWGLITAIIFGLYQADRLKLNWQTYIVIDLPWREWLNKGFGNTLLYCLISVIGMCSLVVFYVIMLLVDKKRLADLDDFLGEKSVEIHEQINKARKDRNKAWLIAYLVIVLVTIFIPLTLIALAIWRSVVRRRKTK